MKININNKEYDAVEDEEITPFPTDAITLDGITYNLTEANPKHEELMAEFEGFASVNTTDAYGQGHVIETRFCELENYPALKEKVSSLIIKALNI